YITFFTYAIFQGHEQNLTTVIGRFTTPENFPPSGPSANLGRTFAPEEIAWLAASVLIVLLLGLVGLYRFRNSREPSFALATGVRPYLEEPAQRTTDSPLFSSQDDLRAADWALQAYGHHRVWGDQLAIDAFAGFANMEIDYGGSAVFTASTMNESVWSRLAVGDYIAVNTLMLKSRPNFYLQPALPGPLNVLPV